MKIEFDQETDAMYIQLRSLRVKKSKEASPGVIIDYGRKGEIIGIEILDASKKMPAKEMTMIDLSLPLLKVHRA